MPKEKTTICTARPKRPVGVDSGGDSDEDDGPCSAGASRHGKSVVAHLETSIFSCRAWRSQATMAVATCPLRERQVAREDHRAALIAFGHDVED